ncbi:hypothetical protein TNCV_4800581 [Trichonephila clavipes]|nr:hypothetical protein TNCV_4800581 [Trichonephila clavipes]
MDCIPARYKEIHFVNDSVLLSTLWTITKQFISTKIKNRSLDHHLKNLTKISTDYLLRLLHLKNDLLVQHGFEMVGSVLNPKPFED